MPIDRREAEQQIAVFLAEKPLYSPVSLILSARVDSGEDIYPGAIRKQCPRCKADTNWMRAGIEFGEPQLFAHDHRRRVREYGSGDLLSYRCVQCGAEQIEYWIHREILDPQEEFTATLGGPHGIAKSPRGTSCSSMRLRKQGQWPAWGIATDPKLDALLEVEDRDLYRKAMMNMSAGYGIGSLAYLRRVIENEVGRLLDAVEEAARADEDDETLAHVEQARRGHNADERLRLVAEATPRMLCVGGINPLKALYQYFSAGIHGASDSEGLDIACRLRDSFEYVFKTVRDHAMERKRLAQALRGGPR